MQESFKAPTQLIISFLHEQSEEEENHVHAVEERLRFYESFLVIRASF